MASIACLRLALLLVAQAQLRICLVVGISDGDKAAAGPSALVNWVGSVWSNM
ncbi:hypothetical protein LJR130_001043 [Variovorax sp. LjRoot130]|uniref:hypothetical protein n=1 Tax=Variovorax sp. LjRoot130 TaxID=3342261 RepID=UPI003ED1189A